MSRSFVFVTIALTAMMACVIGLIIAGSVASVVDPVSDSRAWEPAPLVSQPQVAVDLQLRHRRTDFDFTRRVIFVGSEFTLHCGHFVCAKDTLALQDFQLRQSCLLRAH